MKKLVICFLLSVFVIFSLGCSDDTKNTDENEKVTIKNKDNNENTDDSKNSEENSKEKLSDNEKENKKTEYTNKLTDVENSLKNIKSYNNGNEKDKTYAANEEYTRWNNALNEIYRDMRGNLSKDQSAKLDKEEENWESKRDKSERSDKSAESYKKLADTTKSRCYSIIDTYMK